MKQLLFALALGFVFTSCGSGTSENSDADTTTDTTATEEAPKEDTSTRKSPPRTAEGEIGSATVTVNYGSPSVRGRNVYGDLVPYGSVWRTGANEATTITLSEDVIVEGEALPAGTYALFTIPGEESWTIIFNKEAEQWGAYDYDESMDALRVEVTPVALEEPAEILEFEVGSEGVTFRWSDVAASFKISTVE
ncbi:MAG: DUF2911 domain-containing protein [Phaeodactylibacter sp.]|uniref:DUF2911 domain-containing protein n=1 Tax=Phaeodactylibacter sp. TaxID=1940289 RepID=UPI0032ECAF9A